MKTKKPKQKDLNEENIPQTSHEPPQSSHEPEENPNAYTVNDFIQLQLLYSFNLVRFIHFFSACYLLHKDRCRFSRNPSSFPNTRAIVCTTKLRFHVKRQYWVNARLDGLNIF
jgi:hypothetical protein